MREVKKKVRVKEVEERSEVVLFKLNVLTRINTLIVKNFVCINQLNIVLSMIWIAGTSACLP